MSGSDPMILRRHCGCGGEMYAIGVATAHNQHQHKCAKCGRQTTFEAIFPKALSAVEQRDYINTHGFKPMGPWE